MKVAFVGFLLGALTVFAACSTEGKNSSDDAGVNLDSSPRDGTETLPADEDAIPCEPRHVLQVVCQQCHSRPTKNDAPFSLVNLSDVLVTRSGSIVRDLMIAQLEAQRMPLAPVTIADDQRAVLLDWLHAGAPATTTTSCIDRDAGDAEAGDDAGDADSDSSADAALD